MFVGRFPSFSAWRSLVAFCCSMQGMCSICQPALGHRRRNAALRPRRKTLVGCFLLLYARCMSATPTRSGHRRPWPPGRIGLPILRKPGTDGGGKLAFHPTAGTGFHAARSASPKHKNRPSGTQAGSNIQLCPQERVQGTQYPGSGGPYPAAACGG